MRQRTGAAAGSWLTTLNGSGGLIVEPLRRSPGVLYMCIGLIGRGAPERNAADAFTRLNDRPCDRWAVLETGLPDVERGTTGVVNRQPALLTAAGPHWQGSPGYRRPPAGVMMKLGEGLKQRLTTRSVWSNRGPSWCPESDVRRAVPPHCERTSASHQQLDWCGFGSGVHASGGSLLGQPQGERPN